MVKTILLFMLLLMIGKLSFAQQYNEDEITIIQENVAQRVGRYLTVKGIDLVPNLSMESMLFNLEKQGLTRDVDFNSMLREDGIYALRGTFYGVRDCGIKIIPLSGNTNIVGLVGIDFPYKHSFKQLKSQYDDLKNALSKKYCLDSYNEYFENPIVEKGTNDQIKLDALMNGECVFESIFRISEDSSSLLLGRVKLRITCIKVNYYHFFYVNLTYITADQTIESVFTQSEDDL